MTEFKRYLSDELLGALNKLADPEAPPNWWQEVLDSKDLHLAVRGGYLNAYAQGQSVFKIGPGLDNGNPVVSINYKYLLEPSLAPGKEYIRFNGKSFLVKPGDVICTNYEPGHTLPRLIAAASRYAEEEKKGVHVIAGKNPTVVDLEIAFTPTGEALEHSRALRIDLAALHPDGEDKAKLVFYEAKRAGDSRLRAGPDGSPRSWSKWRATTTFCARAHRTWREHTRAFAPPWSNSAPAVRDRCRPSLGTWARNHQPAHCRSIRSRGFWCSSSTRTKRGATSSPATSRP
jgi:hypothetical protein